MVDQIAREIQIGSNKMEKIKDILKGVGVVLAGSFGISSVIYSVISSLPDLTSNFFSGLGKIIGGSLIGILLIYLAYKAIKGVGKKEKIAMCISIGFLTFLFIASISVVYYMEYAEQITEFKAYSKYGFSFEYPVGMILSEKGLINDTADENSGLLVLTNKLKNKNVVVGWVYKDQPSSLEDALETALAEIKSIDGITDVMRENVVETTKLDHRIIYQPMKYKSYGTEVYGFYGLWYCNENKKQYYLSVEVYETKEIANSLFQRYLDSFVCHKTSI